MKNSLDHQENIGDLTDALQRLSDLNILPVRSGNSLTISGNRFVLFLRCDEIGLWHYGWDWKVHHHEMQFTRRQLEELLALRLSRSSSELERTRIIEKERIVKPAKGWRCIKFVFIFLLFPRRSTESLEVLIKWILRLNLHLAWHHTFSPSQPSEQELV